MKHIKNLPFKVEFVTDEDLTEEKIGQIEVKSAIKPDDLSNNRQSENIAEALDRLEAVEKLNAKYQSAINLPSLRTPSQVKKLYEPVMDTDGVDVMAKTDHVKPSFALPDFSKKATKSKQQRLVLPCMSSCSEFPLSQKVTLEDISTALAQVSAEDEVKARIRLENVLDFFENSTLGQLIQQNTDKIYREAPFAMLKEDPDSKEKFVVRGIVDAYLLLEDRLVLLDYKTDKYTNSEEIKERCKANGTLCRST